MNATNAALTTFAHTYRQGDTSLGNAAYGDYNTRMARYGLYELYADNTIYTTLNRYAEVMKTQHNLYKHIRAIYNPVNRLIDLETAKTYGGAIDWTGRLRTGAIPVQGADDRLIEALIQILKWSNFGVAKGPYVTQGATYGDSFCKVIDDPTSGRVRLEILPPHQVIEAHYDAVGNIKRIVIQYSMTEADGPDKGKDYIYREEIDQQTYRTYKSDKLFAYYANQEGEMVAEWDNAYGFVPVRFVPHKKKRSEWGVTSFQSSLGKINELNDLVSITHDSLRKTVNPVWAVIGGRLSSTAAASGTERDEIPTINLPVGGDIKALIAPVDIVGALGAIDKLIGELERDMPQLALQRIRESGGNASGVSIENSYSDASDLLLEIQGNYDQGLIAALQMAVTIAGARGYRAFRGYTLDSYAAGDLDFYIKSRPVFSDRLTADRRIELLLQAASTPVRGIIMRDLGYSQEDVDEVDVIAGQEAANAVRGLALAAFGQEGAEMNEGIEQEADDGADPQAVGA